MKSKSNTMNAKRLILSLLLATIIHSAHSAATNRIVLSNGVPVVAGPDTRRRSLDGHSVKRFMPVTNSIPPKTNTTPSKTP